MRDALQIAAFPFVCGAKLLGWLWQALTWCHDRYADWKREPPFGNAHWATLKELRKAGNLDGTGFVVGRLKGRTVRCRSEYSCLMFGRPGAGKSLTMGATLHAASGETLVVYDPPGALLRRFQEPLEKRGYQVAKIDLDRPLDGLAYDVCALLDGARAYEQEARLKQLADLATADLHDGGTNSSHFAETSRILVQGVLGWLHANDRAKAGLHEVAHILLSASSSRRDAIFQKIAATGDELALLAVNMWNSAETAKGGEASGFRSSLTRAMEPWITRAYRDLTTAAPGRETFAWTKVFDSVEPQAVFLTGGVLRAPEVKSFVRVFFGQAASTLAARFTNGETTKPTKLMIDEGVVLGRCDPVLRAVEEMRKAQVTVFIGYQSLAQLREIWGKKAQTMLDCCDVILSGGSKSAKDYQEFGHLVGTRTTKLKPNGNEASQAILAAHQAFSMEDRNLVALLGSRPATLIRPFIHNRGTITY